MLDAQTEKESGTAYTGLANTVHGLNAAIKGVSSTTGDSGASEGDCMSKEGADEYMKEWSDWMNAPLGSPTKPKTI